MGRSARSTPPANDGDLETRGIDLNLRTRMDLGGQGRLENWLQVARCWTTPSPTAPRSRTAWAGSRRLTCAPRCATAGAGGAFTAELHRFAGRTRQHAVVRLHRRRPGLATGQVHHPRPVGDLPDAAGRQYHHRRERRRGPLPGVDGAAWPAPGTSSSMTPAAAPCTSVTPSRSESVGHGRRFRPQPQGARRPGRQPVDRQGLSGAAGRFTGLSRSPGQTGFSVPAVQHRELPVPLAVIQPDC